MKSTRHSSVKVATPQVHHMNTMSNRQVSHHVKVNHTGSRQQSTGVNHSLGKSSVSWSALSSGISSGHNNISIAGNTRGNTTPSSRTSLASSFSNITNNHRAPSMQEPRRQSTFDVTSGFFGNNTFDQPASTTKKEYPRIVNHARLFSTISPRSMEGPLHDDVALSANARSLSKAARPRQATKSKQTHAHLHIRELNAAEAATAAADNDLFGIDNTSPTSRIALNYDSGKDRMSTGELDQYLKTQSQKVAKLYGGGFEVGPSIRNLMDNEEGNMMKSTSPVYPVRGKLSQGQGRQGNTSISSQQQQQQQQPTAGFTSRRTTTPLTSSSSTSSMSSQHHQRPSKSSFITSSDRLNESGGVNMESKRSYHLGIGEFLFNKDKTNSEQRKQQQQQNTGDTTTAAAGMQQPQGDQTKKTRGRNMKSSSSIYMSSYTMRNGHGDFNVVRGYAEDNNPTEYKVTRGIIADGNPKVTKTFTTKNADEITFDDISNVESQIENKRDTIMNQAQKRQPSPSPEQQRVKESQPQQQQQQQLHQNDLPSSSRSPEPLRAGSNENDENEMETGQHFKKPESMPADGMDAADSGRLANEPDHLTHCADGVCITTPKKEAKPNSYTSHFE